MGERDAKEAIGRSLNLICELVGILPDRQPSLEARKEIVEFVYKRLGFLAASELKLAFNVAFEVLPMEQKDGKSSSILDHYQSFSIPYLRKVIDFYMKWKYDAIKKVEQQIKIETEYSERKKVASERYQRNDNKLRATILKSYYELVNGFDISWDKSFSNHFNFCMSIGLRVATEEDMQFFNESAESEIEEINKELKNRKYDDPIDLSVFLQPLEKSGRARTIAFKIWLKSLAIRKVSFKTFSDHIHSKACYLDQNTTLDLIEISQRNKK